MSKIRCMGLKDGVVSLVSIRRQLSLRSSSLLEEVEDARAMYCCRLSATRLHLWYLSYLPQNSRSPSLYRNEEDWREKCDRRRRGAKRSDIK